MSTQPTRRKAVTGVHSIERFVLGVPSLKEAIDFYTAFGLDVRHGEGRIDLFTFGHPHRWGTVVERPGPKRLEFIAFGAYPDDYERLLAGIRERGFRTRAPHPMGEGAGVWLDDPEGITVQLLVAGKSSPAVRTAMSPVLPATPYAAAPGRSKVNRVRPLRFTHMLLYTSDPPRSRAFYEQALGLRLSDRSGDVVAFLHAPHGSDHHVLAFAKSEGPGLHHTSWIVGNLDEIGLGSEQMRNSGYPDGWGVGRHVLGSNYFYYVRDPWGSFAEYSCDIDFIPADLEWPAADHPPEDSFYVWGPGCPDYFLANVEAAARRADG